MLISNFLISLVATFTVRRKVVTTPLAIVLSVLFTC